MRVPKEFYETVNRLSELGKQEKSFIVREALKEGLEKLRMEKAISLYKERKLSLSEAAKLADIMCLPNDQDENNPLVRIMPRAKGKELITKLKIQNMARLLKYPTLLNQRQTTHLVY